MAKIAILGAGPVGSLLSILLAKRGHDVEVYERRPDMRRVDIPAGRSINLACSDRGFRALDLGGIGAEIREAAIPMRGRMIHDLDGELTLLPYGRDDQAIFSVSRGALNKALMTAAEEQAGVRIHFESGCRFVDTRRARMELRDESSRGWRMVDVPDLLFGADGARSALRTSMQRGDRFDYSQDFLEHGYKELVIPPAKDGVGVRDGFAIEPNALHIWPRGKFMLIALPNQDRTFTCTLFLPFEGEHSFEALDSEARVQAFFEKTFPDALPLMPTLHDDYRENPTGSLMTVRCKPWQLGGRYALVGDAAHAVVPFYGQGMNAGFEDCRVLDECIEAHTPAGAAPTDTDWAAALEAYQTSRVPDGNAIADLAISNFIEMRDLVRDDRFRLKKRIGARLHEIDEAFLPLYSMVTFSHIRYSLAQQLGREQEALLDKLAALSDIDDKLAAATPPRELTDALARWRELRAAAEA